MSDGTRWRQRFENLSNAYQQLQLALTAVTKEPHNKLYQIALVGAFQFTFELCWKTLKDYLKFQGVDESLPREVIKQAFHHQLITDGQLWLDMLDARNLMAHVYQEQKALETVKDIQEKYVHGIDQVYRLLKIQTEKN